MITTCTQCLRHLAEAEGPEGTEYVDEFGYPSCEDLTDPAAGHYPHETIEHDDIDSANLYVANALAARAARARLAAL